MNGRGAGGANGGAERDPGLERLYHEAARETPPAHLDAAILAAARREVHARPRSIAPMLRHWHVPVSIAAVVVVSVTLVILMREEQRSARMEEPAAAVATTADRARESRQEAAETKAEKETAQAQAATPSTRRGVSRDDAAPPAAANKLQDEVRPESGPPAVPSAGVVATPEPAAKPLQDPFRAAPPQSLEERAAAAPADTVTAGRIAGAPAAPGESSAVPSPAETPAVRAMARAAAPKAAEQDRQPVWHGFEKEPPEKWLARIEELKKQGRGTEAEQMLSEFKRRFPEHPLAGGPK